jgi:hypothetical protein
VEIRTLNPRFTNPTASAAPAVRIHANRHRDPAQHDRGDFQQNADVAVSPNGSSVAVWQSANQDGGGWGIFGDQTNPAVAIDASR